MSKFEIVTIASNAVTAKLHEASRDLKLCVQEILSYTVQGFEQMKFSAPKGWDGRSSFFEFRKATFPAGFVQFVAAHLRRRGYQVRHVKRPLPPCLGPVRPIVDKFSDDPRYSYQMETVDRLEKHGGLIAQIATGGGKSKIAKLAYARIKRPTLFLTTRGILLHQMKESFETDLGIEVSVLGDGQFGHTKTLEDGRKQQVIKQMTVGMVQTLISRLQAPDVREDREKQLAQQRIREQTIALLGKFELVILEEAHEASGNSYYEILKHCNNAYYRLALTATPFMKDDQESNMRLMACSGPIGIRVTEKTLIDRGILATPYFKYADPGPAPKKLYRGTKWQSAYKIGIVENEARNEKIIFECQRAQRHGLSTMVLVQQTKHGQTLLAQLEAVGVAAQYIRGESSQAERSAAIDRLKRGEIAVLIGSTILDVGVDVPAVGMIILAGGGKAEVALRQRIGRGLRAKKHGANIAFIVDFNDRGNDHLKSHAQQRRYIVETTEGFGENIVNDFDFSLLHSTKKAA